MADNELVLHVWPAGWDLQSINAECLAAIIYAQLAIPGEFVVEECTDPDLSPNGQLPYLTHGLSCISTYSSIIKYISGLHKPVLPQEDEDEEETSREHDSKVSDLSSFLTGVEKAQQTAWIAYVAANLGDLVACNLYTLRHNYFEFTRPLLSSLLPVPQRYYVPDRIRLQYKPRLEAAGLWNAHTEEAEQEKRDHELRGSGASGPSASLGLRGNVEIQDAFGREKLLDRSRRSLEILSNLLGDKPYFFGDRPTSLDAYTAAHVLLITFPAAPNDLLRTLLASSYPKLHSHARRIHALTLNVASSDLSPESSAYASAFDLARAQAPVPHLQVRQAPRATPFEMLSLALPYRQMSRAIRGGKGKKSVSKSEEDIRYERMRWAWIGLSVLGVFGWAWAVGLKIRVRPTNFDLEDDEDEEGEEIDEEEIDEDEEQNEA